MANLKDLIVNGSTRLNSDVTISGKTTLGGAPTSDNEAATKNYVDSQISQLPMESITWSNLKTARDGGTLKPGKWYRITDYVTTTAQTNTQSAGHQFDIIVVADSTNKLNENALAAIHTGDPYFQNSKLESWQLKYCLDNDTTRFSWAKADNSGGKGVIYYMKDEWNNECPYDFKNIQFKRWAITQTTNSSLSQSDWVTLNEGLIFSDDNYRVQYRFGYKNSNYTHGSTTISIDSTNSGWYYTFSAIIYDINSGEYEPNNIIDGSIKGGDYYGFSDGYNSFYGNIIKPCYSEINNGLQVLNNIVFNGWFDADSFDLCGCANNVFDDNCHDITFGPMCDNNTYGSWCRYNTTNIASSNNVYGNSCYGNFLVNYFDVPVPYTHNIFGNECSENTIINSGNNTFGNGCSSNTFATSCSSNTFGNNCGSNTFGHVCEGNTFGNNCSNNTFGNNYSKNNLGNNCAYNTFGNYIKNLTVFEGVQYCNVTSGTSSYYVQNAQILNGTAGASAQNKLTITFDANRKYTQVAGLVNGTTLRIWIAENTVTGPTTATNSHIVLFDGTTGKAIKDSGLSISDLSPDLSIPVTYNELVTLKNGNNLVPGTWYRITDYVTTTVQTDTQSAGHLFDIIVHADDESHLNENAFAAIHTGDPYFQNSNLDAWELKYCIDNDTTRFAWADSTSGNGKGVIYYMKDEWNNECPYDFKNIQFQRYKITACTKSPSLVGLYGITGASDYTVDNNTPYWCYTFCVLDTDDYAAHDVSVEQELYPNDEDYYNHSHDNVFKPYYTSVDDDEMIEVMVLPNNVCITDTSVIEGDAFYAYYYNTFGNDCIYNTFGNGCYSNTFGNNCNSNTFGNNCYSNTFGNSCYYNTFENECYYNTFENNCNNNTFGNDCIYNTFGNDCYFNTFRTDCYSNTFGSGCNRIQFIKNYTYYCIVENGNQCIILTSTQQTSSNNKLRNIIIAQGVNNTSSNINISHNTVNDAFQTIYAKDSSGNLKSWVSADIETSYSDTDHNLSGYRGMLAKKKVYTGVLGVANGSSPNNNTYANRSVYFLTVHPRSFDSEWTIHYRVNIHLDDEDKLYKSSSTASVINLGQLCRGTYDCILSGTTSVYTVYSSFNSIRNTSYRPIYYHIYHGPTQAGFDEGYKIGVSFADAYNGAPVTDYSSGSAVANTKYSRTIEVVIDECVNCTAELNDVLEIEADAYTANGTNDFANYNKLDQEYYLPNTSYSNSAGRWVYNNAAADNGLRESGDATDTSNIYLPYTKLTAGTKGIMRNSLIMQDSSGNWQSFTTTEGASSSSTPANKTPNTTTAFRPGSPIYYIASSSTINPGDVTITAMVHAALLNLRYSINAYSITTGLPLFIKGTIHSDGYFYIDGDTTDLTVPWWTQSPNLLTDGAGKIYITVCEGTYDTYRGDLISSGEMWHFDENGVFCRYYPGTGDIDWGTWS